MNVAHDQMIAYMYNRKHKCLSYDYEKVIILKAILDENQIE